MTETDKNTEEKILEAATTVFVQKGKAAARMQEIADKAGINKALLHYYYRSKDKLFEAVFTIVIKQLLLPKILKIFREEEDIFEMIRKTSDMYINVLIKNPFIPMFILEEINKNPKRISNALLSSGVPVKPALDKIQRAMDQGKIRKMDPRQVMVNLVSLCVFPFGAKNIILPILFGNDKRKFRNFLEQRKTEVADFIISSIKTN